MECPVCFGMGENAESDCEGSKVSFTCNDKIAACITVKLTSIIPRIPKRLSDWLSSFSY